MPGCEAMMNFCDIVGCGKRSDRDKGVNFYRLPAEISHQWKKTQDLSKKRRANSQGKLQANFLQTAGSVGYPLSTYRYSGNAMFFGLGDLGAEG